ncbi:MAG: Rha family transcriptional regulator [Vibrio sp.]
MTTLTSPIDNAKATDLVFTSKTNKIVTNSLSVAEYFGKLHKNVLRSISNLECSDEFNQLNFERVHYHDKKGEVRQAYQMTKDGFMFLVMGFTGKRAAEIKERYINAFNEMADQLSKKKTPTLAIPNFERLRIMITVENGVTTQTKLLDQDELIINRNNLDYYMRDPEVFPIEQLIKAHNSYNERLENFMQAKLRR